MDNRDEVVLIAQKQNEDPEKLITASASDLSNNSEIKLVQSRCSPIRFCNLVGNFNINSLKAAVREMGFGGLLHIKSINMHSPDSKLLM